MRKALGLAFALLTSPLSVLAEQPAEFVLESSFSQAALDLVFAADALWALGDGQVLRLDPGDGSATAIPLPPGPADGLVSAGERYRGLAVGEGALWVADLASSTIVKIDLAGRSVVGSIPTDIFGSRGSIGVGAGSLWVVTFDKRDKRLTRYDAATGAVQARIDLPQPSVAVLFAFDSVWVTATSYPELYRIDPATDALVDTIALEAPSPLLEATADALWVSGDASGVVQRIEPSTGAVVATVATGASDMENDGDLASGGGYLWTINRGTIVARVDLATNRAEGLFRPPLNTTTGRRVAYGAGSLWISGSAIVRLAPP